MLRSISKRSSSRSKKMLWPEIPIKIKTFPKRKMPRSKSKRPQMGNRMGLQILNQMARQKITKVKNCQSKIPTTTPNVREES
jgi:hypothetical protein